MASMDIEKRNAMRAAAGLPLLDARAEELRLAAARRDREFEDFFQTQRHRFSHLWADRSRGFWTNMGIWNAARKNLRREMQSNESDG
jgi:hypothetical protein